jgi:predicted Zn-dependent peptidase
MPSWCWPDIDMATARPLVEKYFGDIPAGPAVKPVVAGPVTLPAPIRREMTDQVATTRLSRIWSGPGTNDPDAASLAVGMSVLGGWPPRGWKMRWCAGTTGRLGQRHVEQFEQVSFINVSMDVKASTVKSAEAALTPRSPPS